MNKEEEIAKLGPMTKIKVQIPQEVYQKIMYWIDKAPGEISGLGKIALDHTKGTFSVLSVTLLDQVNSGASTDLDPADISKAMFELREQEGMLNFWWHSHVNMAVFWSGTDIDTIRTIGQNGFVLSTVFNKRREMLSSYYHQATDLMPEIFIDGLETEVTSQLSTDTVAELDRLYEAKCKSPTYSRSFYCAERWSNHYDDSYSQEPLTLPKAHENDYWSEVEKRGDQIESESNSYRAIDLYKEAKELVKKMKIDKDLKRLMVKDLYDRYQESRKIWNNLSGNPTSFPSEY